MRAYSQAVKEGLKNCVVLEKKPAISLQVRTDYTGVGKIQYLAAQSGMTQVSALYEDTVTFNYLVPVSQAEAFEKQITEKTAGRAEITRGKSLYYGLEEGKLVIFQD